MLMAPGRELSGTSLRTPHGLPTKHMCTLARKVARSWKNAAMYEDSILRGSEPIRSVTLNTLFTPDLDITSFQPILDTNTVMTSPMHVNAMRYFD